MLRRRCSSWGARAISRRELSHRNVSPFSSALPTHSVDVAENDKATLHGQFIGIKANILVKTTVSPSTAASRTLSSYHPPYHATVISRLLAHGASILPNANMDEFGMGSHSQYSHLGPVQSSFTRGGKELSPGGSSGGSAVWVKQGLCEATLGTDTGGSVRLPAAYTGVVGFKPSYGRVSRWGVIQYANSMDTVGFLGKNVESVRRVFRAADGYDRHDPTSLSPNVRKRMYGGGKKERLNIGVPLEYNISSLSPEIKAVYVDTLKTLQDAGHTLVSVSLPTTRVALSTYYVLAPAEASSNLAKFDGIRYGHRTQQSSDANPNTTPPLPLYAQTRDEGFGEEVKRRILLGTYTLSSEAMNNYFIQAQKVRRLVQQDFDRIFAAPNPLRSDMTPRGSIDVLVTPTAPTLPPTISELESQSPVESYMNDVFTVPSSLAGLPAISVPVALLKGRQLEDTDVKTAGIQFIGQFGSDEMVMDAAQELESMGKI